MHTAGSTYYSMPLRHSMRPSFAIEGSYLLRLLHRQSGGVVVVCMWVSVCVCVLWCSKSWHKLVSYVVESPFSESCQGLYRVKVGWGCSLLALLRLLLLSVRRSKEKRRRRKRHTTVGRSLRSTSLVGGSSEYYASSEAYKSRYAFS